MGMIGPVGYPASPAPEPKKRPVYVTGAITIVSFVALLYVIEFIDRMDNHQLDQYGIRPLRTDGLDGILFAPLLHLNWTHLMANTIPALVLGFLMTLGGLARFFYATAVIWIAGGFGTWLLGDVGSTCGGPTVVCVAVFSFTTSTALASPKSRIFSQPSGVTRKLPGFRSR